jgi:uncharacterized membrane protein YfcA
MAVPGAVAAFVGAVVLSALSAEVAEPWVAAILFLLGVYILWRFSRPRQTPEPKAGRTHLRAAFLSPLGAFAGLVDAMGGGGWGPVVTSCLMGAGGQPRYVIGTVNAAEFLVTLAIVSAFVTALLTGHWQEAGTLLEHAAAVAGLIVGGLLAAPVAGFATRIAPPRVLGGGVGALILSIAGYQAWSIMG